MARQTVRYVFTLIALQAVFGGIAFLLSDLRWVAPLVSFAFLVLVWKAGASLPADLPRRHGWGAALLIGVLWQLPGLQGTLGSVSDLIGITQYNGNTDLMDFAMETWHTVLLPLLAALPPGLIAHYYARYYIVLLSASPLLILLFVVAALTSPFSRNGNIHRPSITR